MRTILAGLLLVYSSVATGAQFITLDDHEVHYVLVNTLFLAPEVAQRYGIERASNRAIVNLSVIGPDGIPRDATVTGEVKNLLGQRSSLSFERTADGDAIYFIAPVVFTDQDVLSFTIDVSVTGGPSGAVSFQERMWLDRQQ
jgi:hypothetical protein